MATYQDQEEQQNEGQEPLSGRAAAPVQAGGASTGGPGNKQATGQFVNFDSYFQANQPKAQEMATGLNDEAQKKAGEASTAIEGAYGQFQDNVKNNAATAANPYAGPSYFGDGQDLSGVYGAVNTAEMTNNALGSFGGRQAMLQDQNKNVQNYSQGMSRFDAALAGTAGGDQFAQTQAQFPGFDGWYADYAGRGQNLIGEHNKQPVVAPPPSHAAAPRVETVAEVRSDEQKRMKAANKNGPRNPEYMTDEETFNRIAGRRN